MSGSDYPKRKLSHDDYRTDQWILNLFPNFFDPCPLFGLEKIGDGLVVSWDWSDYDGVFVNPPYSNPKPWIQKAIKESNKYHNAEMFEQHGSAETIVLLLKHDSSTEWYRLLHEAGAHFLPITGRLRHQTSDNAAFPSILAVLTT
jgi:hypothetical protein